MVDVTTTVPLGQQAMAASLPVVVASNQTAILVSSPGLSGGILQSVTTLTNATTAYPIPATPLAGRASMLIQNAGTATIYIGASTVTADTAATGGTALLPGQSIPMQLAAAVLLYAISASAGQKVQTLEMAA